MTRCKHFADTIGYPVMVLMLIVTGTPVCQPLSRSAACADEPSELRQNQDLTDRWHAIFDDFSNSLQIHRNGFPLNGLEKATVLNMLNPDTAGPPRLGRIYLWTERGQPVLVACVFTNGHRDPQRVCIAHEFHSLDSQSIELAREQPIWNCPTAGIEWLRLQEPQGPSPNRTLRLVQMRNIARSFRITGAHLNSSTDIYDVLPQPIYRYEQATGRAQDGTIFIIGQSTDPYAFVLIEARDNAWWVAFARSTVMALEIERNDTHFSTIPRTTAKANETPFYIDFVGEIRSVDDPDLVFKRALK